MDRFKLYDPRNNYPTTWDRSYKALAVAVLVLAIKDVTSARRFDLRGEKFTRRDQEDAYKFLLQDWKGFPFWCQMAGLDPIAMRQMLVHRITSNAGRRMGRMIRAIEEMRYDP